MLFCLCAVHVHQFVCFQTLDLCRTDLSNLLVLVIVP